MNKYVTLSKPKKVALTAPSYSCHFPLYSSFEKLKAFWHHDKEKGFYELHYLVIGVFKKSFNGNFQINPRQFHESMEIRLRQCYKYFQIILSLSYVNFLKKLTVNFIFIFIINAFNSSTILTKKIQSLKNIS